MIRNICTLMLNRTKGKCRRKRNFQSNQIASDLSKAYRLGRSRHVNRRRCEDGCRDGRLGRRIFGSSHDGRNEERFVGRCGRIILECKCAKGSAMWSIFAMTGSKTKKLMAG